MLKISFATCIALSLAIMAQFTIEMCVAAWNRKKINLLFWWFRVV